MDLPVGHKDRVPDSFPGTVLLQDNGEEKGDERYTLHPEYRKKTSDEFKYFVRAILTAVNGKNCDFKRLNRRRSINDIFSVSDEAFALLMLRNEYHCWKKAYENGRKKDDNAKSTRTRKLFTSSKIGSKEGMTPEGRFLYQRLVQEVGKLRQSDESHRVEKEMLEFYIDSGRKNSGKNNSNCQSGSGCTTRSFDIMNTVPKDDPLYHILMGTAPRPV